MNVKELITKLLNYDMEKEVKIQEDCMSTEILDRDIVEEDNIIRIRK